MTSICQWNASRWGPLLGLDLKALGTCSPTHALFLSESWNTEVPVTQLSSDRHGQCAIVFQFRIWWASWQLGSLAPSRSLLEMQKPMPYSRPLNQNLHFYQEFQLIHIHINISWKVPVLWVILWSTAFLITGPLISGLWYERNKHLWYATIIWGLFVAVA